DSEVSVKIGIIGHGFVGLACETGFQSICDEVVIYDKYKPSSSLSDVISSCDVIFVCVPTPMGEDDECSTYIVEGIYAKSRKIMREVKRKPLFVIKSTVVPETTEY